MPLKFLDVILVIAAAPFVVLAGLPALGYVVGAVAWIVARAAGTYADQLAASQSEPRRAAFITMGSAMARAWLVGLSILAVGLAGEREDGLTAAVLVLVAFTVYLALSVILRPQRKSSP